MHLNGWAFNHPYTFRGWTEEEWRRSVDILACQGVNLFFLWPFMEIMPVPLSPVDAAYLHEVRRVTDYARDTHGMEVWVFQSANRVAASDCAVLPIRGSALTGCTAGGGRFSGCSPDRSQSGRSSAIRDHHERARSFVQIAHDLVRQLHCVAAFEALGELTSKSSVDMCAGYIENWLDRLLAWDARHGWSDYWRRLGKAWSVLPTTESSFSAKLAIVKSILRGATTNTCDVAVFLEPIRQRLASTYDAWVVDQCDITPLIKVIVDAS